MTPEDKAPADKPIATKEATASLPRRRLRQEIRGIVVSDKMDKTRVIEVLRNRRHRLYHKSIVQKSRLFIHDEKNQAKLGDVVLAVSSRPLSRHKHFRLKTILESQGKAVTP